MRAANIPLVAFAWLSLATALLVITLKSVAYWITGSVGLLSDALESVANVVGASAALIALTIAARPADDDHPYGHGKAEYFSSGLEGGMILVAALAIAAAAIERLLHPQPLERIGIGLAVFAIATVINLAVARILLAAGQRHHSIALEADARHLMTDVWTSVGVLLGVGAVMMTGLQWLDAAIALVVAANIVRTGISLVRRSVSGLMDSAMEADGQRVVHVISTAIARREFSITRCAHGARARVGSSIFTCWCLVRGRCSEVTTCWSASKPTYARSSQMR